MHKAIIKGRVHGVGFRAAAKAIADKKGHRGTVRNLPDGTVELILCDSRPALENFIRDIAALIPNGSIEDIIIQIYTAGSPYKGFAILR